MNAARDKYICGKLEICWHERPFYSISIGTMACTKCGSYKDNPDFSDDAGTVRLLREMMKREDWNAFKTAVVHSLDDFLSLITDTSGALAQKALEWFEGRRGNELEINKRI